MTRRAKLCFVVAALAVSLAAGSTAGATYTGSLALNGALDMTSTPGTCPPGAPPDASLCAIRIGDGQVPGLGHVSENYVFYVHENACGSGHRVLETTGRFDVVGKGELRFALPRMEDCVPSALDARRSFTITGGTGIYAGASGSGTVVHQAHYTFSGAAGTDTWTGALDVPGLEFDLTPPTLTGAVNRTVRTRRGAKRARVRFSVTATDQVDGSVQARCTPRSGSWFRVGRTTVKCSATDSSANTATTRFRVVVKRGR